MSSFLCLLNLFSIITYSQNYVYNDNYQLSQSNWEDTCQFYYDAHLASIHNDSQRVEAQTTAGGKSWIGLSDSATEDMWLWTDGTMFNYGLTYFHSPWNAREPNDQGGEDCVEIEITEGLWNDLSCLGLLNGLCAYPIPMTVISDKWSYLRSLQPPGYIGVIDILDEIYIDFYITFHSWPTMWGNILQFGDNDTQRYPGIYVHGPTQNIMSSFATVTTSNPEQSITTSNYSLNTEYHYTLYQTQRRLTVTFGGDYVYDDIYDYSGGTAEVTGVAASHPIVMNQAINVGNIWRMFDATIRNLVVTTANSPETTFWNYICDWDDRWTTRSGGDWVWGGIGSGIDGDCSVRQSYTGSPTTWAWIGEKDPDSLLWTDYKIEMIINLISGDSVGPLFRATNVDCDVNACGNAYILRLKPSGYEFGKFDGNGYHIFLYKHSMGAGAHSLGTPYLVRVECAGNTFKIYEDNKYLFNYSDASYSAGSVGIRTASSDAIISKVRLTFPQNQQLYTANPSAAPSSAPTFMPTSVPTIQTKTPTIFPTTLPTKSPTTSVPTTSEPTTSVPTTSEPTTSEPTTSEPTTSVPTTSVPTTSVPTKYPSKSPSKSPTNFPTKSPTTSYTQNHYKYAFIVVSSVLVCCIVLIMGFYVNKKRFQEMKKENNIIDYQYVQLIGPGHDMRDRTGEILPDMIMDCGFTEEGNVDINDEGHIVDDNHDIVDAINNTNKYYADDDDMVKIVNESHRQHN